ncbi:Protein phosphatase PTC7 [Mortierella claussenii]|nr:Protein phosphatase PTC7 [Mortierella claussenii]
MTPSRLMAVYSTAASHRIAHWITQPFAMVHMQRYLSIAPQLLLTHPAPHSAQSTTAHTIVLESCAQVHTSAVSLQQQQQQQQQQQHQQQQQVDPLSSLEKQKQLPSTATSANQADTAATGAATATTTTTAPGSAVAFNYLLAASWHPKSRTTRRSSRPVPASSPSSSSSSSSTDESGGGGGGEEQATKWWKQKLRAGKVDAGEDAFFHVSTPSRVALGVADGVGGWAEVGVDPALFSWALMDNAEAVARLTDVVDCPGTTGVSNSSSHQSSQASGTVQKGSHHHGNRIPLDAQSILDGAYSELVQSGKVDAGSSTACILSLCKLTGTLRASNLGDSAFLLIRDNQCIFESPSQQHFWNCPYQLTVLPPGYPGAKQHVMDMPKDAAQTSHQLQDGDVIVLATDGFWDNVFTNEAIELVDRELGDVIQQSKRQSKERQQQQQQQQEANGAGLGGRNFYQSGAGVGAGAGAAAVEMTAESDLVGRVRALSQRLTNTARRFSLDPKRRTPFSQSARHIRSGGKVDDITVIVTLVRARHGAL